MSSQGPSRAVGVGRVLITVYAILALAATARSAFQIATKFEQAPVAYLLSALAGVVYILATVALVKSGDRWYRIAWVTIVFELLGVITVGTLSLVDGILFPADTVWSFYGRGYLFIPFLLPILGMIWLYRFRSSRAV